MKIGLIDVDGHNYPNLPLMKLSAWHKRNGDHVEWYDPMFGGNYDKVYMSKVFSFTPDYEYFVNADVVEKGGSGYCISIGEDGREHFDKSKDKELPYEVEHIYPDYSLYGITDTAYGFLTRGCPRGCDFCHVKDKEGMCATKVADLSEFWDGQKNIILMDANTLACRDRMDLLKQLEESKAKVEFNQGIDVRMLNDEVIDALNRIKLVKPHFAWDRYEDRDKIVPKFRMASEKMKIRPRDVSVFVLCGNGEPFEHDIDRVMTLRELGFSPYVMVYEKDRLPKGHTLRRFQRWVNNRIVFWSVPTFEEYQKKEKR